MKNKKLLLGTLIISALLCCCTKNDNSSTVLESFGHFTINSDTTKYDTSIGYLMNNGTDTTTTLFDGYKTYLLLHSNSIHLEMNTDSINEFKGEGNAIGFYLYSSKESELTSTDYICENFTSEPHGIGTFCDAYYWTNWNSNLEKSTNRANIISAGKVSVSKNDNNYTITYDCTSKYGKRIVGEFSGSLTIVDRTEESIAESTTK